jgi:hypothetical protein
MTPRVTGWSAVALVSGSLLFLSSGCIATADGGGEPNVNGGIGLDYYDQFGVDYGNWGPDYAVGPYRGGGGRPGRGDGNPGHGGHGGHGFRPAPPSHGTPSIPSGPRAGGHRGH